MGVIRRSVTNLLFNFKKCVQQIAPLDLEMILEMHEKVLEAGVIGKPHPDFGEVCAAFVATKPGLVVTEQELLDYVAAAVS